MKDDRLRIPTKEIVVELALQGGERQKAGLYLAEQQQHLIDLLEDDTHFLPAVGTEHGDCSIFSKRALLWVSITLVEGRLPIEEADGEARLYDSRADVEITFVGGESLAGEILYSPPAGQTRVSDHLNEAGNFFRLWTADLLYLVNKHKVLRVIETAQEVSEEQ